MSRTVRCTICGEGVSESDVYAWKGDEEPVCSDECEAIYDERDEEVAA